MLTRTCTAPRGSTSLNSEPCAPYQLHPTLARSPHLVQGTGGNLVDYLSEPRLSTEPVVEASFCHFLCWSTSPKRDCSSASPGLAANKSLERESMTGSGVCPGPKSCGRRGHQKEPGCLSPTWVCREGRHLSQQRLGPINPAVGPLGLPSHRWK